MLAQQPMRRLNSALSLCVLLALGLFWVVLGMRLLSRLASNTTFPHRSLQSRDAIPTMGSLRKIPHDTLHVSNPTWWLESRFHFSFADYHDPARQSFGALRVVNDDLVQGKAGFGTHPHRDAEIFSYIVDGHLSHKDSMGNSEALPRGCVQYLSAGTGITHSELNEKDERTRFLQIWMTPDRRGHKPQYGSTQYSKSDRHNKLLQILGGTGSMPPWENASSGAGIKLHQDANVFVSEADAGFSQHIQLGQARQAYLVCIEGDLAVNSVDLTTRDAIAMAADGSNDFPVKLTAGQQGCHFLIVEMQKA